jgi:hypothetical protein
MTEFYDDKIKSHAVTRPDAGPITVHAITRALRHFESIIWDAGRWSGVCQEELKVALRQIGKASYEIERLAEENRKLKGSLDYAWRRIEAETGAKE